MNFSKYSAPRLLCLALAVVLLAAAGHLRAGQGSGAAQHDGQHDFDFNIGTWHTHIKRLQHPASGADTWIALDGTVTVRKVWDGRGELEEIEADGPNGHWEGLTLFLYNPQSRQWSENYAGASDGTMTPPMIGEFKNGKGEFYGQDTLNGRAVLARGVWSDIAPNSHRYEISLSDDGGKTWQPNFIAELTRQKP